MRRAAVVLNLAVPLLLAACGSADPSDDPPVASPSSSSGTAAPSWSSPGGPAGTPPPVDGAEVPGPLPWGPRTLTGIVERSGDCTLLLVGGRRWALTGEAAATLSQGDRVTVRGSLTTRSAACADLAQAIAVARVDPA
jgi:hypothetical protein